MGAARSIGNAACASPSPDWLSMRHPVSPTIPTATTSQPYVWRYTVLLMVSPDVWLGPRLDLAFEERHICGPNHMSAGAAPGPSSQHRPFVDGHEQQEQR